MDFDPKDGPGCNITEEEAIRALSKMRRGEAAGQSYVASKTLNVAGEVGVDWMTDLCNCLIRERKIP